jgi:ACS family tartrate transporter-like MFS transporter
MSLTDSAPDPVARAVRRKTAWRLLPLIFVLYVVAYLDRANLGFARKQMVAELHFSDAVFGLGAGIFFIGYQLLEIPGALIVERWSARKWFARILVTWGICSMAMALVRTENQFYGMRFLLGLAEAGFFPGVIVYFTHWFPRRERARALSALVFGVPFSLALGAYTSSLLIEQNWFGVTGWQWMFLFEGAPAVLLGIALPFILPDRPRDARWLTTEERDCLEGQLAAERRELEGQGKATLGQALAQPAVWLLAFGIMAINTGGYAIAIWLSSLVEGLLQSTGQVHSSTAVLVWTGFVYLCGIVGIGVAGWSSDRLGERKWHCVAGLLIAAFGLAMSIVPGQPWFLVFAWLCVAGFGAFFWIPPFWVLPTQTLTASAAAVAVGVINMCANLAGFVGPSLIGQMKMANWSSAGLMLFLAACYLTGAGIIACVPIRVRSDVRGSIEDHG